MSILATILPFTAQRRSSSSGNCEKQSQSEDDATRMDLRGKTSREAQGQRSAVWDSGREPRA